MLNNAHWNRTMDAFNLKVVFSIFNNKKNRHLKLKIALAIRTSNDEK